MNLQINLIGTIVDKSKNPILGVSILVGEDIFYSDKNGDFNITINGDSKVEIITFSHPLYGKKSKSIIRNDKKFKTNLGIIRLKSQNESTSEEISNNLSFTDSEIDQIIQPNKNFEYFQQKKLGDLIKTLKLTLIPIILTLLKNFGISKISEATSKKSISPQTCPSPEKLKKIIEKRNKLVKQLNITFTTVDLTLKSLGVLQGILLITEASLKLIPLIPIPSPPSVSIAERKIDTQVKKYKALNGGLLSILLIIRNTLSQIINLLESLDFQIQSCTQNSPEFETLNQSIVEQINLLNRSFTPSLESINGFNFSVETEQTTNELKRKRAVAKNSKGVILLRGEYSYSSSTQILIEELAFYIKINDLKAD